MKLITKHTTLSAFKRSRWWFIRCPRSGVVYKIVLIRMSLRSERWYGCVEQRQDMAGNMMLRLIGSPNTVIENRSALLHRLQTKQFEIRL